MSDFRCWDPENCEEEDAKTIKVSESEWAAEWAAKEYMKRCWADTDWVTEILVHVRDEAGQLTKWNVRADPDVVFNAAPQKETIEP